MITSFFGGGFATTTGFSTTISTEVSEDDEDEDDEDEDEGGVLCIGSICITGGVIGFLAFLRQQHHHKSKISASNANPPTIHPIKIFLSRRA